MRGKLTRQQKMLNRQVIIPSGILYWILLQIIKILNARTHTHFTYRAYPGKDSGPFVLISNHASRNDYMFTAPVCAPRKLNYVVGYNEFYRFPINIILFMMQVIPKKNFVPDFYCIRQIFNIIRQGGSICIMPEGMSSITGMAQPVIPGGAKLLKKLGVNVYYTKVAGGYLTYTKHCLDERIGRIEVVVDQMFTAQQLKSMSVEEIEDTMNRLLAHDDYMWNKKAQVRFLGKGDMAKKLDTLLYMCPKCRAMYQMKTDGNAMRCEKCGNGIVLDEYYKLSPADEHSVCPEYVTDWTIMEREQAAKDVSDEQFSFSEHVRIGTLPQYKSLKGDTTSIICGDGMLTLDRQGLHFNGTMEGETLVFDLKPSQVPTFGMCTDISRFYTFVNEEFIEFYPDSSDVLRWVHLTEELHRACGGKWQNTAYRHCEDM